MTMTMTIIAETARISCVRTHEQLADILVALNEKGGMQSMLFWIEEVALVW